jgi:hypothetical protein
VRPGGCTATGIALLCASARRSRVWCTSQSTVRGGRSSNVCAAPTSTLLQLRRTSVAPYATRHTRFEAKPRRPSKATSTSALRASRGRPARARRSSTSTPPTTTPSLQINRPTGPPVWKMVRAIGLQHDCHGRDQQDDARGCWGELGRHSFRTNESKVRRDSSVEHKTDSRAVQARRCKGHRTATFREPLSAAQSSSATSSTSRASRA